MINKTNYKLQVTSYKLLAAYCRLLTACCGLLLTAYCLLPTAAFAQCPNVTLTLTPTPSTCQSNGTIRVAVSGSDAGNLQMTNALYRIVPVAPSSYSQPWATAAGGTLTGVPPGTYTVGLQAFCTTNNAVVEYNSAATVVTGNYVVPNVYFGTIRKTLSCIPSGLIPIEMQNGRAPYTIRMTQHPTTYTGPTSATITTLTGTPPRATHNFDDLPAGTYSFIITDNCNYNTVLTNGIVTTASADYSPAFVYAFLYAPATVVQNDCQSVRVYLIDPSGSGNASHDAWPHYSNAANAAKYYEVALSAGTATAPTTGWATPTTTMTYTLPVDYNTFRAQSGRVAVWIRLKGASCAPPALMRTVSLSGSNPGSPYTGYSNQTCTDFTVTHRMNLINQYVFCYPYQWQITAGNGASTVVPWTSVTTTDNQIAHNVPYGAWIEYRDASGQTWMSTLPQSDPLSLITLSIPVSSRCISNSLPLTSSGILSSSLQVYSTGGNFPVNTRIETIGWPAGGPAPNHPDITVTNATTSNVYPYTSSTDPTTLMSPYLATMPGTYTFRVSMPTCPSPRTFTVTPIFYTATPMSYTSIQGCNDLTVFPTGQLGSITGSATSTLAGTDTWFFIQNAPAGVTVNTARVQAGGSLTLPASGAYVIGMARSTTDCASNTLTINYTKPQLSLNTAVTTAYVCPGGGTGFIRVQGTGGSGSYTYQLYSGSGLALTPINTSGTFSYGSAGQTYTVRVFDSPCGTSFDQMVTILNLNAAAIASSSSPNNEFCEGSTIQLLCMNLGNTSHSWTGPGTWTSTQQNPTRPNATAAMAGTYTVSVIPEGCSNTITHSVVIRVNPKPSVPQVPNNSPVLCRNAAVTNIAAVSAASVTNSSSFTMRYYNSAGSTITGTTNVPTTAAATLTYYVSQYNNITGCESDRVTIMVHVRDVPAAPTVNPVAAVCSGSSFTITVSPVVAGHYYKAYAVSSDGAPLQQSTVGSGVISGLTAPAANATWYVSAVDASGCESARTSVSIPVTPTVTPALSITVLPD